MAIVKVSIKDKNTLELQEDAKKHDLIDLSVLSPADVSSVTDAVRAAARREVEQEISKSKANELEAVVLKKETELKDKYQKQIFALELEKNKADMIAQKKDDEIQRLKSEQEQALQKEKQQKEIEKKDYQLQEKSLKERHESELKEKDNIIAYYKDLKLKQNSKMLGETVEKHCHLAFETIRGFLPSSVKFGKDTDASEGSMGDRIYREYDEDGNEVLSIMFEMKNEGDETKSKNKNEDFFKELDKDRNQKKCEYAVLVTMLEKDNDLYDEMYPVPESKYKEMYVIRPQHFTKIIMWLRNISNRLSASRRELVAIQQRDRDYTEFDKNFAVVRDRFQRHYFSAADKHNKAIDEIDKMIKGLERIKEDLQGSSKQLRLASEDLDDVNVKKLAKNSPSIMEQFKGKEKLSEGLEKTNKTKQKTAK